MHPCNSPGNIPREIRFDFALSRLSSGTQTQVDRRERPCLFAGKLNNCIPSMLRLLGALSLLLFSLAASLVAQAPSSTKPSTSRADYSQEGFVIEQ